MNVPITVSGWRGPEPGCAPASMSESCRTSSYPQNAQSTAWTQGVDRRRYVFQKEGSLISLSAKRPPVSDASDSPALPAAACPPQGPPYFRQGTAASPPASAPVTGRSRLNPLFKIAIAAGSEKAVALHIDRGGDVNATDERGRSALLLAVLQGHTGICRLLLESGADPLARDDAGNDALTVAISENHIAIADLLRRDVERGADSLASDAAAHESPPGPASDGGEFDLDAWESHDESLPLPLGDPGIVANSLLLQQQISAHRAVDADEDWSDVEILLPSVGRRSFLAPPVRAAVEELLYEGLETGWLLREQFADIHFTDDDLPDPDFERFLAVVAESLEIAVESDYFSGGGARTSRTPEADEDQVADAVGFLDDLLSPDHNPLYQYLAEIRSYPLLSTAEEQALGSEIEETMRAALVAITGGDGTRAELLRLLRQASSDEGAARLVAERAPNDVAADDRKSERTGMPPVSLRIGVDAQRTDTVAFLLSRLDEDRVAVDSDFASRRVSLDLLPHMRAFAEPYTREQIDSTLTKIWNAHRRLIEGNLRLVVHIAYRYRSSSVDLLDLIQEGNFGLMRAVERFDHRRGFKFSTYASWWIRQAITRAIADHGRTIRLPVHVVEKLNKMNRAAKELDLELSTSDDLTAIARRCDFTIREVTKIVARSTVPEDIDVLREAEAHSDEDADTAFLEDPAALRFEDEITRASVGRRIEVAFGMLPERHREVLRLRFGFVDDEEWTLEEIGGLFDLTRERIRQIESKAIAKLRHPAYVAVLSGTSDPSTRKKERSR